MAFNTGAMTDFELRREIEYHRTLISDLAPDAPARRSLQDALDAFLAECEERKQLRSVRVTTAAGQYPDDAS
jgi:signal transduction histidine kinase